MIAPQHTLQLIFTTFWTIKKKLSVNSLSIRGDVQSQCQVDNAISVDRLDDSFCISYCCLYKNSANTVTFGKLQCEHYFCLKTLFFTISMFTSFHQIILLIIFFFWLRDLCRSSSQLFKLYYTYYSFASDNDVDSASWFEWIWNLVSLLCRWYC